MTRPAFSLLLALVCAACSGEGRLQHVPRERTLITDCVDQGTCSGQFQDYDAFNPYLPGKVSRTGYNFLYEPLYFYNAYRDEIIPWIATGHEYNADYTEDHRHSARGRVERRAAVDGTRRGFYNQHAPRPRAGTGLCGRYADLG